MLTRVNMSYSQNSLEGSYTGDYHYEVYGLDTLKWVA